MSIMYVMPGPCRLDVASGVCIMSASCMEFFEKVGGTAHWVDGSLIINLRPNVRK